MWPFESSYFNYFAFVSLTAWNSSEICLLLGSVQSLFLLSFKKYLCFDICSASYGYLWPRAELLASDATDRGCVPIAGQICVGVGSDIQIPGYFPIFLVLSPAGVLGQVLFGLFPHSSESVMALLTGGLFQAVVSAQPQPKPHAHRMLVLPPAIEDVISTNNSNSSHPQLQLLGNLLPWVGELPILVHALL